MAVAVMGTMYVGDGEGEEEWRLMLWGQCM